MKLDRDCRFVAAVAILMAAGAAAAQETPRKDAVGKAETIATQPARDLDASRTQIPAALQQAIAAPYGPAGTRTCATLASGVKALDEVLGPDFTSDTAANENRASRLAEAGGKTVVNSLVPFRGLVREISGAAPAQRRLNAAMDAGYARRGYLRGLQRARRCKGA